MTITLTLPLVHEEYTSRGGSHIVKDTAARHVEDAHTSQDETRSVIRVETRTGDWIQEIFVVETKLHWEAI